MQAICSYCNVDMGLREPVADPQVTHGLCDACFAHFEAQWDGQRLGEFLDQYDAPVVAVTGDARVIAVNTAMAAMLNIPSRDATGLLGGEFMECVHARMPERCGNTVHCSSCTVRGAIERTMATSDPVERQPAWVDRDDGRLHMFISTVRVGEFVRLVIEESEDAPDS